MTDWSTLTVDLPDSPTLADLTEPLVDPGADLVRAINTAGPVVEQYTDRVIARRPVMEVFAHHFGTVMLRHPPLDEVVVSLDGEIDDSYRLYPIIGDVAYLSRIGHSRDTPLDWRRFDRVEVRYVSGYDRIPSALGYAISYVAAGLAVADSIPGQEQISRMSINDVGSMTFSTPETALIPQAAAELLRPYRRQHA